jgi:tetratricopeptide (TPR) repeat protein
MTSRGRNKKKGKARRAVVAEAPSAQAVEEALARGDARLALEAAKALARASNNPAVESLLGQAYAARIVEMRGAGLDREASELAEVARRKCPTSASAIAAALATEVEETWSFPLTDTDVERLMPLLKEIDPATGLPADARSSEILGLGLVHPMAVAHSEALDPGHPVRRDARVVANAILGQADETARRQVMEKLASIPSGSPLFPWASLLRAFEFIRQERYDDALSALDGIPGTSALAPAREMIHAYLDRPDEMPASLATKKAASLWNSLQVETPRERLRRLLDEAVLYDGRDASFPQELARGLSVRELGSPLLVRQAARGVMQRMIRTGGSHDDVEEVLDLVLKSAYGGRGDALGRMDRIFFAMYLDPLAASDNLLDRIEGGWSEVFSDVEKADIFAHAVDLLHERVFPETEEEDGETVGEGTGLDPELRARLIDRILLLLDGALGWNAVPWHYARLAAVHEALGQEKELEEVLEEWREYNPDAPDPLLWMADEALEHEDLDRAIAFSVRALDRNPEDESVEAVLACASFQKALGRVSFGDQMEAIAVCRAAASRLLQDDLRWTLLGLEAVARRLDGSPGRPAEPGDGSGEVPEPFAYWVLRRIAHVLPEPLRERLPDLATCRQPRSEADLLAFLEIDDVNRALEDQLPLPEEWGRELDRWIAEADDLRGEAWSRVCELVPAAGHVAGSFEATRRALALPRGEVRLGDVLVRRANVLLATDHGERAVDCLRAAAQLAGDGIDDTILELVRILCRRSFPDLASSADAPVTEEELEAILDRERRATFLEVAQETSGAVR